MSERGAKWYEIWRGGASLDDIASQEGVSRTVIHRHMRKHCRRYGLDQKDAARQSRMARAMKR
jgi:transposase